LVDAPNRSFSREIRQFQLGGRQCSGCCRSCQGHHGQDPANKSQWYGLHKSATENAGLTDEYRNLYITSMKTTLDINDSLLANAKALAAQQRTSLTRLIEEGLQLRLRSSFPSTKVSKRKIPVFKGRGGLVAGLDPSSNKAMLDVADNDA
jgi:hypothetical protein